MEGFSNMLTSQYGDDIYASDEEGLTADYHHDSPELNSVVSNTAGTHTASSEITPARRQHLNRRTFRDGGDSAYHPAYHQWSYRPRIPAMGASHNPTLLSLMDSQKQILAMVENVTQRLGTLEKAVTTITETANPIASSSSPAEEKKRIPSQLSVSHK